MAIVEMKRVSLLAMASDKDKLLRVMQRAGCVQITAIEGDEIRAYISENRARLDTVDEKLTRIRWTIGQLGRFAPKQGMLSSMQMPEANAEQVHKVAEDEEALLAVVEAVEACERRSGALRGQEARIKMHKEQLTPWRTLDIPVEMLKDSKDTVQFVGAISNRGLETLTNALAGLAVRMDRIGEERDNIYVWIIAHRCDHFAVAEALKAADFSAAQFTQTAGIPAMQLEALARQYDEITMGHAAIEEELRALAAELPRLKLLYELAAEEKDREAAAANFAQTSSVFLMEGWVPEYACERLEKKLRAAAPGCDVEFRAATDEETPPTLLHNHRAVAPFEAVVSNFSLPDPRGLDPTFVMAPFFACFFGMMVSDAGYGLILAIGIPIIIHFLKPKPGMRRLMWVLAIGGVFTVFWGAMFDTWFGESIKPMLLNPLEQPLQMMGVCIGLGVLHLFAGLGVAAYMNIKRGKVLDAVFDQLLWITLIVGIAMLFLPATAGVGKVLAIVSAVGIFLTAGRAKPNIIGKFIGGFSALYGITSWLSDILSYMRLFGMGLATGVIGMVVNMLVRLVIGKGIFGIVAGIAILLVGHVFNAFINILGAYVHACRLQYIEFFGKFYEDGGRPFSPLAQNPRYVAIREMEADGV